MHDNSCWPHRQCKCIKYMSSKHSNKLQKAYKEKLPSSTEKKYLYIKTKNKNINNLDITKYITVLNKRNQALCE